MSAHLCCLIFLRDFHIAMLHTWSEFWREKKTVILAQKKNIFLLLFFIVVLSLMNLIKGMTFSQFAHLNVKTFENSLP